jgi:hypothetical protein
MYARPSSQVSVGSTGTNVKALSAGQLRPGRQPFVLEDVAELQRRLDDKVSREIGRLEVSRCSRRDVFVGYRPTVEYPSARSPTTFQLATRSSRLGATDVPERPHMGPE